MSSFSAVVIIAVFLLCAYFIGRFLGMFEDARFHSLNTKTWSPLLSCFDNPLQTGDCLTGSFHGREVRVKRGEKIPAENGGGYNFEIDLASGPGAFDWTVEFAPELVVFGKRRGSINTKNQELKRSLTAAGVVQMIEQLESASIQHVIYDNKRSRLVYNEDVRPALVPAPEQFRKQLEMLSRLAEINEQVNSA